MGRSSFAIASADETIFRWKEIVFSPWKIEKDRTLETIGLIIFASMFVVSGLKHIKNHSAMAGYTASAMGDCPLARQLGYLGGCPTGLFLVVFGVGAAFNDTSIFAYGLAAFLLVVTALFHRNF